MLCKFCGKTLYSVDGMLVDHNCIVIIESFRNLRLLLQDGNAFLRTQDQLCIRQHIKQPLLIYSLCKCKQYGIRGSSHGQSCLYDHPLRRLEQILVVVQMFLNLTCTDLAGFDQMDHKILREKLGLPPEATDEQVFEAIEAGRKAKEDKAAAEQKAAAAEADKTKAEGDLANACKERDDAKTALENCKKDLEETKTALANEKAQHAKTKELKTAPATGRLQLSNEQVDKSNARMALVNEKKAKGLDFMEAWKAAVREKPELFKD